MFSPQKIEISYKTIVFTVIFIVFIWMVIQVLDIILLLFISFILMAALRPLVDWFVERRLPRIIAILLLYIIGLSIVGVATSTIIPPLITQSIRLANQLPEFISELFSFLHLGSINFDTLSNQLGPLSQQVFRITIGIFNNVFSTLTTLVFTFYFLLEREHLEKYLQVFIGEKAGSSAIRIIYEIEDRLGAWVRGEILLMTLIGLASYIGLLLLKIEFALPLALIAGILEIVPVVGPIVSAVPAVIVALATSPSPLLALAVIGLYFIVQQLENHIVVPLVMRQAVGLPPVVTLTALLVGGRIGGMSGAILAVPVIVTLHVLLSEIAKHRRREAPMNCI